MVKTRSQQAGKKQDVDPSKAEALADEMADKPYGSKKPVPAEDEPLERITFTMAVSMYDEMEVLAKKRKRAKADCRSMAAIAREAVREYLDRHNQ
ncbi:hypothetical protein [Endozoicomonas sp.]|uniref:hypothetical protein n=1 Tax=Endozoicomonas sp. TaxID=1892382 RepID=UPI00288495B6|nr:hypothetical protein [Endozoicomonas sp.]